jgi:glycosyltransferase involved in cell wall biosynthesis
MEINKTPYLSIIIPVYKAEKFLEECLNSIKKQTFSNYEILLIDDGSPDKCPEICDESAKNDNRIRVFHQINQGVSAARNKGIQEAWGEWIAFIDPDDWIDEQAFSILSGALSDQKETDVLIFDYCLQNKRNAFSHLKTYPEIFYSENKEKNRDIQLQIISQSLFNWPTNGGGPCNKWFRKEIIKNIFFPVGMKRCQDLVFCLYVYEAAEKILYIQKPLYYYRLNEKSASHSYSAETEEKYNRIFFEFSNFIKLNHPHDELYWDAFHLQNLDFVIDIFQLDKTNPANQKSEKEKINDFIDFMKNSQIVQAVRLIKPKYLSSKRKVLFFLIKIKCHVLIYSYYRLKALSER